MALIFGAGNALKRFTEFPFSPLQNPIFPVVFMVFDCWTCATYDIFPRYYSLDIFD